MRAGRAPLDAFCLIFASASSHTLSLCQESSRARDASDRAMSSSAPATSGGEFALSEDERRVLGLYDRLGELQVELALLTARHSYMAAGKRAISPLELRDQARLTCETARRRSGGRRRQRRRGAAGGAGPAPGSAGGLRAAQRGGGRGAERKPDAQGGPPRNRRVPQSRCERKSRLSPWSSRARC